VYDENQIGLSKVLLGAGDLLNLPAASEIKYTQSLSGSASLCTHNPVPMSVPWTVPDADCGHVFSFLTFSFFGS
jgi:hypothetical protein